MTKHFDAGCSFDKRRHSWPWGGERLTQNLEEESSNPIERSTKYEPSDKWRLTQNLEEESPNPNLRNIN